MEERELEHAERFVEQERAVQIAAAQKAIAPEYDADFDGKHCLDCGSAIPPARLAMGRIRCVHCQTLIEHKSRMFAR